MRSKIVEATQGYNFGKFLVAEFEVAEIEHMSLIDPTQTTLAACGFGPVDDWRWVLDIQTREGMLVQIQGAAMHADFAMTKHKGVRVCPMYLPTLRKLFEIGPVPVENLPSLITLTHEEALHISPHWRPNG